MPASVDPAHNFAKLEQSNYQLQGTARFIDTHLLLTNHLLFCASVTAIEYTANDFDPIFSKYAPTTCQYANEWITMKSNSPTQ